MSDVDKFIYLHLQLGPYTGNRLMGYLSMEVMMSNDMSVTLSILNGKRNDVRANGDYRIFSIGSQILCPLKGGKVNTIELVENMTPLLSRVVDLVSRGATESEISEKKNRMLRFIRAADNKHIKNN